MLIFYMSYLSWYWSYVRNRKLMTIINCLPQITELVNVETDSNLVFLQKTKQYLGSNLGQWIWTPMRHAVPWYLFPMFQEISVITLWGKFEKFYLNESFKEVNLNCSNMYLNHWKIFSIIQRDYFQRQWYNQWCDQQLKRIWILSHYSAICVLLNIFLQ